MTKMNASIYFQIESNGDYHTKHYFDVETKGPNGMPDMNGFDYGFRLGWEDRGNWGRPHELRMQDHGIPN